MKKILPCCFSIALITLVSSGLIAQTPKYEIGDKAHGGIIAWITKDGKHGLVCSESNIDKFNWEDAKKKCSELQLGGKDDWYLPSEGEMHILHENLYKKGLGGFTVDIVCWSNRKYSKTDAFLFNFLYGYAYNTSKDSIYSIRAVRAF